LNLIGSKDCLLSQYEEYPDIAVAVVIAIAIAIVAVPRWWNMAIE